MTSIAITRSGLWRDYFELTKPKVVALIVFTAMVGMLLATTTGVALVPFVGGSLGIALMAGAAAAFNHLLDRRLDRDMQRTCLRPLPNGRLGAEQVASFATALGITGFIVLWWLTNPLAAWLTLGSLVGYALIYTAFLKRATPQNIVIGGAAGAAPPLLGWVAMTGQVDPPALVLFLIIFIWTPPHFWPLAIHRRAEYAQAGVPMLPVTHGNAFTRLQIWLYTWLLLAVSLLPCLIGMSGWLYGVVAIGLSLRFLYYTTRLYWRADDQLAMPIFGFSIAYLFGLFTALLADHFGRLFLQ